MQKMHTAKSDKPVAMYDLDVVISVGYRIKSERGGAVPALGYEHPPPAPCPRLHIDAQQLDIKY